MHLPASMAAHTNSNGNGGQVESEATPLLSSGSGKGSHVGSIKGPAPNGQESSSSSHETMVRTTAALSVTLLVQSFLLVGVFPYSGFLAMHLVPSLDEETAGRCAGLIASSFMVGRAMTSFFWGKAADRHGRTFAIKASLLLSAVFSVLFGLAPTLPLALAARFALGLSNGIIGSIKTIVTEMSHGDRSRETRTVAIVMGMWGYGFLINPALSGYLADPVKQYPDSKMVGILDGFFNLTANPFLLPNLLGCALCLSAYFSVRAFVEETLPVSKIKPFEWSSLLPSFCKSSVPGGTILRTVSSWGLFKHLRFTTADDGDYGGEREDTGTVLPRWASPSPSTTALTILAPRSSSTAVDPPVSRKEDRDEEEEPATIRSLWERPSTRKHLVVYWAYSFAVIAVDETFPLYCMSKDSGLGVGEKIIGNLLSGTGAFYIFIQFFLVTSLVDRYGLYKTMRIGALCSVPLVCLVPLSLLTNRGATDGAVTWTTMTLLSALIAVSRACSSVTFSTLTMTTNRTVPAHHRAAMNGLSMLGGSFAKAAGPAFAGVLFSASVGRVVPPMGSVVVWTIIAFLGLGVFVQALLLPEYDPPEAQGSRGLASQMPQDTAGVVEEGPCSTAESEDRPPSF